MDLLLLAKVVRMEADIRQHQLTLDRSGVRKRTLMRFKPIEESWYMRNLDHLGR